MEPGARQRLKGWRDLAGTAIDQGEVCIVNTSHTPGWGNWSSRTLPTAMRNSSFFDLKAERFLLPGEILLAHGHPVPGLAPARL